MAALAGGRGGGGLHLERKDMDVDDSDNKSPRSKNSSDMTTISGGGAGSQQPRFWFDIQARAFQFSKSSKQWSELGLGSAEFHWDGSKVRLGMLDGGRGKCLEHLVDVGTGIDPSVGAQQSWVFRAQRQADSSVKDVLCLQFASVALANHFCSTYEACRREALKKNGSSSGSGSGLGKQRRDQGAGAEAGGAKTRVMRRRLTVAGGDPNLDGHELGAGSETSSPRPTSPRALRNGQVGQWPRAQQQLQQEGFSTTSNSSSSNSIHVVAYSGVSRKGVAPYNPDKQNQDSMIMSQLPVNGYCNGELLLACFDGHGAEGHLVSRHIAARLPKLLCSTALFAQDAHTGQVLADALLTLEKELMRDRAVDTSLSGTTAVVSVLRGNKLFVANVGDSRIIKGQAAGGAAAPVTAQDLSTDHKPDDERETARITAAGGRVFAMKYDDGIDGPARVWLSYADMPGLAMSRSLCDTIGKEAGVISNAELHVHELQPGRDKFIVLATDGLWEFMTSQEVTDIVTKHMADADPRSAISELVRESNRRWQLEEPVIDDTTIIIAYMGEGGEMIRS